VQTEDLTPALARHLGLKVSRGALVDRVTPGGPSAAAGIRGGTASGSFQGVAVVAGGDVVVAVNGRPVASASDFVRIVTNELRPGQTSVVSVLRAGRTRSIAVRLGSRPADPQLP
jgi:S1-C subfamily serine protease